MRVSWTKYKCSKLATLISVFGGAMRAAGIVAALEGIIAGIDGGMIIGGIICIAVSIGLNALAERVNARKVARLLRDSEQ